MQLRLIMDVSTKKQMLIDQLLVHFNHDMARLNKLGNGLRLLGIDTNNEAHLDNIAAHPEQFLVILTYSDLGILEKLIEPITILRGV